MAEFQRNTSSYRFITQIDEIVSFKEILWLSITLILKKN